MSKKFSASLALALALAANAAAQNTNSSTTRNTNAAPPRRPIPRATPRARATPTATPDASGAREEQTPAAEESAPRTRSRRTGAAAGQARAAAAEPGAQAVRAVFDTLLKNIERSDVDAVMSLYWNSPQLTVFNNNGTVTRGWAQVRSNRASSYPEAKDVKIEARDVRVQMLGPAGAVVTCLWRQSQEFRGAQEASTGRLTVVFRLINNGWKIVHTHSSPEAPDPSRLAPSEQTAPPAARTAATPPPR
ncbi:MAG TPA: nuclear transport factor 2 family protein [Pyrinomonadaceae bacterium]|nr:nuclear transport factor 2 family protein [Pyrinomonadaceae bacterium]